MSGEAREGAMDRALASGNDAGATALLLSDRNAAARTTAFEHALTRGTPGNTHVVAATYDPDACVEQIRSWAEWPAGTTVLAFDDDADVPAAVDVTSVPANDATTITDRVHDHVETATARARHTVFYFDSLSQLVEDVGVPRTFRFLDGLTDELGDGVTSQFHLDPSAHRRRTVLALSTLFDVVAASPDGETWRGRPAPRREPSD